MRVLIIGGYGTFGGRLVDLLEEDARLTLLIGGRSLAKAEAFCRSRTTARAELIPLLADRDGDLVTVLRQHEPAIVVDASGPFQGYGGDAYRVIEACFAAGADYLDLADASAFVTGVSHLDARARQAGRFALTGVSSVPALSFAAIRALSHDMSAIVGVRGGIAPSPHAIVGRNVIRAIASYAGTPIAIRRDGREVRVPALVDRQRFSIAVAGAGRMPPLMFCLVDVPDLALAAQAWPDAREIWFGAATRPQSLLHVLRGLAWLRSRSLMPDLALFAGFFHRAGNIMRWGAHRGGMFIEVTGTLAASPAPVIRAWHLIAEGDDGPYIPSMACAAVIRACLAGRRPPPGARPAHRDLELADFAPFFEARNIRTTVDSP